MTPEELMNELNRAIVELGRVSDRISYGDPPGGMLAMRHIALALEALRNARSEVRPFVGAP